MLTSLSARRAEQAICLLGATRGDPGT
jgi:hypothetical protein